MKTFIAGSPISHSLGFHFAPDGTFGRTGTFKPPFATFTAAIRSIDAAVEPEGSPQTSGSGPEVTRFLLGWDSSPSDPRHTFQIGNLGIRKSVKIRKIGKACSNLSTRHLETTRYDHPKWLAASERKVQMIRRQMAPDLEAWPSSAESPLRGWSTRDSFPHPFGRGTSLPMISFDSPRGRTLETFSDRSEQFNDISGRGCAGLSECVDLDGGPNPILCRPATSSTATECGSPFGVPLELREKLPQLELALEGHFTEHHRFLLRRLLSHLNYLENQDEQFSKAIAHRLDELLPPAAQQRLDAIDGVNRRTIENVIAEIGPDMTVFPDEHQLCSWTGICPGNEESAGKRLRSRTRKGNRWLRRALAEAAWAASHAKETYLAAQYRFCCRFPRASARLGRAPGRCPRKRRLPRRVPKFTRPAFLRHWPREMGLRQPRRSEGSRRCRSRPRNGRTPA